MKSKETLEEAAANLADPNLCKTDNWIAGAKWQQERMYSEEEVLEFANWCRIHDSKYPNQIWTIQQLFEKYEKETLKTK